MDNNKHTFIVEHFDRQIARQNEEMKRNLIRAADEVARLIEQLNEIDQMIHVYRPTRGTDNGEVLATDRCVNATRQQAVAAGMALAGAA